MLNINIRQWLVFPWQRRPTLSSQAIGVAALFIMVLCSSTYNVFAKLLTQALSPITLVFVSEALTAFFVLLSFGTLPTLRKLSKLQTETMVPLLAISVLSGICGPMLWFIGLSNSTAVNAALFGNGEMIFLWLFAVIILRETFNRIHIFSILIILAGLATIALQGFSAGITLQIGDALLLLSCASYAGGAIVFRKYLHHLEPHLVILARSAGAVIFFFLVSPFLSHPLIEEIQAFPLFLLPVVLGFGFISRFLNLFSFYEAMDRLEVTTVSLSFNFTVLGSIALAAWALGEQLYIYHFVGGALIIAGAFLLELSGLHPSEKHLEGHLQQGQLRKL